MCVCHQPRARQPIKPYGIRTAERRLKGWKKLQAPIKQTEKAVLFQYYRWELWFPKHRVWYDLYERCYRVRDDDMNTAKAYVSSNPFPKD